MKKVFMFGILLCATFLNAQPYINSLSIKPATPTEIDKICLFAHCGFSSGDCKPWQKSQNISDSVISANAMHCLGMLTIACTYTDTFEVGPLAPGKYKFIFQLESGFGGPPCTPGIVAGPVDTLDFVVSPYLGLPIDKNIKQQGLFPNPSTGIINFLNLDRADKIAVMDITGRIVHQQPFKESMNIASLPEGIYFVEVYGGGEEILWRERIVLNK